MDDVLCVIKYLKTEKEFFLDLKYQATTECFKIKVFKMTSTTNLIIR